MSEASRSMSMIDEMMERLGETADLSVDDQARETVTRSEQGEANSRSHPVVAVPLSGEDRDADNEFLSPTAICVSD